jgi:hypothetical protein
VARQHIFFLTQRLGWSSSKAAGTIHRRLGRSERRTGLAGPAHPVELAMETAMTGPIFFRSAAAFQRLPSFSGPWERFVRWARCRAGIAEADPGRSAIPAWRRFHLIDTSSGLQTAKSTPTGPSKLSHTPISLPSRHTRQQTATLAQNPVFQQSSRMYGPVCE